MRFACPSTPTAGLGSTGSSPALGGQAYRNAIDGFVARLNQAGLYVVIDEHVAAPAGQRALGIIPMPDADSSPAFWSSVASHFAPNHSLVFDLYNEPHDVGWDCWLAGCEIPAGGRFSERHPAYLAAGMQRLVDAVRSTGATQPLMLGGTDYARDLSGWLAHEPVDPLGRLVASEHNYGHHLAPCLRGCKAAIASTAASVPVVVGELGQTDCRHDYIDKWMRWADRRGISYIGWAWDAKGRLDLSRRTQPDPELPRQADRIRRRVPQPPAGAEAACSRLSGSARARRSSSCTATSSERPPPGASNASSPSAGA